MEHGEINRIKKALTQHADDLQLYANGLAEDAVAEFEQTEDKIFLLIAELYAKYEANGLSPDYQTARYLESLQNKIREIRENIFDEIEDKITGLSTDLIKEENEFHGLLWMALAGVAAESITKDRLNRIAKYGIYNGNTRKQIFDRLSVGDAQRIFDALSDSFQHGKSIAETGKAVKAELLKTGRFVKTELDIIVNGMANDAALEFAAANKSVLRYSAILDNSVCGECASLDGGEYEYDNPEIPSLPRHANCRCSLTPVPAESQEVKPMPFPEYVASMPPKDQQKRLGQTKYRAWKSGDYALKKYESPNPGQRLSMADLRTRNKAMLETERKFNPHESMKFSAPITGNELTSIRGYTCGEDGLYRKINQYMAAGKNATPNPELDVVISHIKSALNKSTLAHDITVYRGLMSDNLFLDIQNGVRIIPIKSLQSTSLDRTVSSEKYALNNPGVSILMDITLPKGTNCINVSKISTSPDKEAEILLNPAGQYRVTGVYYNEASKQLEVEAIYEKL